ncbi:MAG: creatininase family protein [Kiritimatiellae bacterium]|nr:creatininase family protein [Kiritimatiellia bacterium]
MANADQRKVRWEEMFPDEFLAIRQAAPVCYLAYGLAEPHGAYNALGLDWLKAQGLVERAARTYGGIVAPPFAWHLTDLPGFHDDGQGVGWFVDAGVKQSLASGIPPELFYRMMLYQIRAVDARDFQAAILVTGHYGGVERDMRILAEFYLRQTRSPLRLTVVTDGELIRHDRYRGDHAGVTETSQLASIRPDLVDLGRMKVAAELGERFAGQTFPDRHGTTPNRELGDQITASQVARLGELQAELLAGYRPRPDWCAPDMNAAGKIWSEFERLTRRYWVAGMSYADFKAGRLPEFPGWAALQSAG